MFSLLSLRHDGMWVKRAWINQMDGCEEYPNSVMILFHTSGVGEACPSHCIFLTCGTECDGRKHEIMVAAENKCFHCKLSPNEEEMFTFNGFCNIEWRRNTDDDDGDDEKTPFLRIRVTGEVCGVSHEDVVCTSDK
jgi:hypothetical protein